MDLIRGRTIGHGSSATVSAAASRSSGEILAVKSVDLSRSDTLRREHEILSTLSHSNIIGHRGSHVSIENGKAVFNLIMEFATGGTLAAASRRRPLDESTIGRITSGIISGLDYLHSRGIVHCDIKGSNILLENGEAKIADFGCSKVAANVVAVGGTPLYMSPETAWGEEQSFPADIWAVGCTVIEMATGKPPWPNNPSTLGKIAFSGETPEVPEFLTGSARDFLDKCLRVDPRKRWTAGQLKRHHFVGGFGLGQAKEVTTRKTSSPTSVLDRGDWGWAGRGFSVDLCGMDIKKRIKELYVELEREEHWECGEEWVLVRDGEKVKNGRNLTMGMNLEDS